MWGGRGACVGGGDHVGVEGIMCGWKGACVGGGDHVGWRVHVGVEG